MAILELGGHEVEVTLAEDGMLGVAVDGVPKGSIRVVDPVIEKPEPPPVVVTPDSEDKTLPPGWELDAHGKPKFVGEKAAKDPDEEASADVKPIKTPKP